MWFKEFWIWRIAWWQVWNFIVLQTKFNRYLHPNKPPRRFFWYLPRRLRALKISYFEFSKAKLLAKIELDLSSDDSSLNVEKEEHLLLVRISVWLMWKKDGVVKICKFLKIVELIIKKSFGYKDVLNFTCLTLEFHSHTRVSIGELWILQQTLYYSFWNQAIRGSPHEYDHVYFDQGLRPLCNLYEHNGKL